jgi:glutathione S-transferase
MFLIGQYDSPFVRRVGITLKLYGLAFEHRRWSVWGDAEALAEYNPLRRVPTLVLDDGTVLVETWAILDALDELVGPEQALLPRTGPLRREGMRVTALASGMADKAVSLLYEGLLRSDPSEGWVQRCRVQIRDTLTRLERELSSKNTPFWLGPTLSHADVACACSLSFAREAHPHLFANDEWPRLSELSQRCEALAPFSEIRQPIVNNLAKPGEGDCYAVIFSNQRASAASDYDATAERMESLARIMPGYLSHVSARGADGFGITVSYWSSLEAIALFRAHAEHAEAQRKGRALYYASYDLRVARVTRQSTFVHPDPPQ